MGEPWQQQSLDLMEEGYCVQMWVWVWVWVWVCVGVLVCGCLGVWVCVCVMVCGWVCIGVWVSVYWCVGVVVWVGLCLSYSHVNSLRPNNILGAVAVDLLIGWDCAFAVGHCMICRPPM